MKNPVTIFLPAFLILAIAASWAGEAISAPLYQSPKKKPTPDPYFNPQNATPELSTNLVTPLPNSVRSFAGEPFASQTPNKSPLTLPLPPAKVATQASLWEAPLTPFSPTSPSAIDTVPKAQNRQGAELQTSPIGSNSFPTTDASIIRNKFLAPVPHVEPKSENQFSAPTITKRNPPATQLQLDQSSDFGSEFSADLSQLKRPASEENKGPDRGLDFGSMNSTTPDKTSPETTPRSNHVSSSSPTMSSKPNSTPPESTSSPIKTFEPTQLLAMVGNEPIFVGDLMFEINQLIEKFMPTAPPEIKASEGKKMISKLLPKFVDSKMLYMGTLQMLPEGADVSKILEQAGKEFDEKAMQQMMDSAGIKTPSEFDAQLRAQGSSLRKMRLTWSQDQLTKYFLSQQLGENKEVTHQAMLDDYHARQDEYAMPARAKWEQVMVRFDRTSSRADAEKQLVEMGNAIVYGANFAAVAKKSSHGFRASKGGQHDWTSKGALVLKELDEAIFSLPIGELSDKIETTDGFHIVRVLERTAASHKPFLEAQVEIKERMIEEKRMAAFKKHIEKLKDEIPVEYFNNELSDPSIAAAPGSLIR